jgi:hypothetical protein
MQLEDLIRARARPQAPTMEPGLAELLAQTQQRQGLAQRGAVWELPNWGDDMAPGTIPGGPDPLRGFLAPYSAPGLFGGLGLDSFGGGLGGGPLGPPGAGGGGGDYSTSGGFSAAPPGQDFQGYDLTPKLVNYQGVETSPAYARLIKAAEKKLGMPEISDFAGSDYRSHEEQAALYADHLAGRHPAPVAPPGQSYHEQAEAIDWDSGWLAEHPEVRNFFTNHGVTFDVPGEPWHGHMSSAPNVQNILNPGASRPRRRSGGESPIRAQSAPLVQRRRRRGGGSYSTTDARQR